jgi:hypothetical protein
MTKLKVKNGKKSMFYEEKSLIGLTPSLWDRSEEEEYEDDLKRFKMINKTPISIDQGCSQGCDE